MKYLTVLCLLFLGTGTHAASIGPEGPQEANSNHGLERIELRKPDDMRVLRHQEKEARQLVRDVTNQLRKQRLDNMEVEIVSDNKGNTRRNRRVEFRQLIDGIPLKSKSKIILDSNGNVLRANIVSTTKALPASIKKKHALRLAEDALGNELGSTNLPIKVRSTKLQYLSPKNPTDPAIPQWTFDISVEGKLDVTRDEAKELKRRQKEGTLDQISDALANKLRSSQATSGDFTVRVNAYDGTAEVLKRRDFINFTSRVCQEDYGTATIFGDPSEFVCEDQTEQRGSGIFTFPVTYDVREVFDGGACVGTAAECADPDYSTPNAVISDLEDWMEAEMEDCCATVSDVDVMVDSTVAESGVTGPGYKPSSKTIIFPETGDLGPAYKPNANPAQDADVITHETAHHILTELNPDVADAALLNQDPFAAAVVEGMADVVTALHQKSQGASDFDAFKVAEGSLVDSRDLRTSHSLNDYIDDFADRHDNGEIIGNVFFRMYENGAAIEDLADMAGFIMRFIEEGNDSNFNWDDMFEVIDEYLTEGTTPAGLRAIFEGVWVAMGGNLSGSSGGGGGSSGVPDAPSAVIPVFSGCVSGSTFYNVDWPSVSGADFYFITGAGNNGSVNFWATTTSSTPLYAGVSGTLFVAACNNVGCSSQTSAPIAHFCSF